MNITVSENALQRCTERLGCSEAEARALLTSPAVRCAVDFGARIVRCQRGRIVLAFTPAGATVLTVLPLSEWLPRQLLPTSWGGPPAIALDPDFHRQEERSHAA